MVDVRSGEGQVQGFITVSLIRSLNRAIESREKE